MAKKIKGLLKGQKLTFDNHHPNVPATWDGALHFHKSMTVPDDDGKKQNISGVFYVAEDKAVDVQWDQGGNNHKKIIDDNKRKKLRDRIVKEIKGALADANEAHEFLDNIWQHLKSISAGLNEEDLKKRFEVAFDNIMSALGIASDRRIEIKNREANRGFFALYVDAPRQFDVVGYASGAMKLYNRYYHGAPLREPMIYFVSYDDDELCLGELTPSEVLRHRLMGYRLSGEGVIEGAAL